MKRTLISSLILCLCLSVSAQQKLPYKDKNLPIEKRLADLLGRMTLEEKVGQLRCTMAWNYYEIKGKNVYPSESFKKDIAEGKIGMLWATYRADPWTQKTLTDGLNPELAAKAGNALQRYVAEHTRLGIPLFLAEEAPHGHMAIGTTVFPTGIGMAATFSPDLICSVGGVIGKEIRLQGGHISYGPVLDLAREPRWSRVEETMGEDPVLTATLGAAMVKGLGGGDLSKPYSTIATLKHFIAYGTTEGGQNGNQTVIGPRELADYFLPPFKKVIDAGALSVMTSYNSLDGVPSTANNHLLRDVLKRQWGFRGFVVSDLFSIDGIWETHHVVPTLGQAAAEALRAGVDADLGAKAYAELVEAVKNGKVDERLVDEACANILRLKFEMGLFDNPYVEEKATKAVRSAESIQLAGDVARASVTLLENKNHLLPLGKELRVAVVGPNADNRYNLLGDYTAPQPDENVKTILDGVRSKLPAAQVEYAKGCAVRDMDSTGIRRAVEAARRADVVIACVGGSSARDFKTTYKETGAAVTDEKTVSDMDCGEGFDRATLSLLGRQQELLETLKQTGKPLVVVYIEGRPLEKNWAAANADALIDAYYPGQEGGQAIADVIFGDYNPAGRLPYSIPKSTGQLPVYYNKRMPAPHKYVEMDAQPLYSFGYGLSYTTFEYANMTVEPQGNNRFLVSLDVRNSGEMDGDEVVQLYLHDVVASAVQPLKQLKHFARVHVKKGETRRVEFQMTSDDFEIVDRNMERVVEPGEVELLVGSSSDRILLKKIVNLE